MGVEEFSRDEVTGIAGACEASQREADEGMVEGEIGFVTWRVGVLMVELILPVRVHPSDICNGNKTIRDCRPSLAMMQLSPTAVHHIDHHPKPASLKLDN